MTSDHFRTSHIDTILFDLDGTLIDSIPFIYKSFRELYQEFANKTITDIDVRELLGPPEESIVSRQLGERASIKFLYSYEEYLQNYVRDDKTDSLVTLLYCLKELGYKCGIVTNKGNHLTTRTLLTLGIQDFFKIVITGDAGFPIKPFPGGINHALDMLDAVPERTVMVGDTDSDLKAARAANVNFIHARWFQEQAQAFCDGSHVDAFQIKDLYSLLELSISDDHTRERRL